MKTRRNSGGIRTNAPILVVACAIVGCSIALAPLHALVIIFLLAASVAVALFGIYNSIQSTSFGLTYHQIMSFESSDDMPTLWVAAIISFVVFALDVHGWFRAGSGGLRYTFLLVPLIVVVLALRRSTKHRKVSPPDILLGLLVLWGLSGALYGKVSFHPVSSALTIMLPMTAGFLHLFQVVRPSEKQARRMLDMLTWAGAMFLGLYFLSQLRIPLLSAGGAYAKEQAFLLTIGPAAAVITRRWYLVAAEVLQLIGIFFFHPTGTFAIALLVILVTCIVLSRARTIVRSLALGALLCVMTLGFFSVFTSTSGKSSFVDIYFQIVGGKNNTPFRRYIVKSAIAAVKAHPLLGTNFTGPISFRTPFPGAARYAPPHNDLVQLAVSGGLIAAALYVDWLVVVNYSLARKYKMLLSENPANAAVLRVLAIAFNVFVTTSLFNPLLDQVGIAVMFFLIYGSILTITPHDVAKGKLAGPTEWAGDQICNKGRTSDSGGCSSSPKAGGARRKLR